MGAYLWMIQVIACIAAAGLTSLAHPLRIKMKPIQAALAVWMIGVALLPILHTHQPLWWFHAPGWFFNSALQYVLLVCWGLVIPLRNLRSAWKVWHRNLQMLTQTEPPPDWLSEIIRESPFVAALQARGLRFRVAVSQDVANMGHPALTLSEWNGLKHSSVILLRPITPEQWELEERRWLAVLGHECGHIACGDLVANQVLRWVFTFVMPREVWEDPTSSFGQWIGWPLNPIRKRLRWILEQQERAATAWGEFYMPGLTAEMNALLQDHAMFTSSETRGGLMKGLVGSSLIVLALVMAAVMPGWAVLERSMGGLGEIPLSGPVAWECGVMLSLMQPGQPTGREVWWAYIPDGPSQRPAMHVKMGTIGRGYLMGSAPLLQPLEGVRRIRIEWEVKPFDSRPIHLGPSLSAFQIGDRFSEATSRTDFWDTPHSLERQAYLGNGIWGAYTEIVLPPTAQINQMYFTLRLHRPCDLLVYPPRISLIMRNGETRPFATIRGTL